MSVYIFNQGIVDQKVLAHAVMQAASGGSRGLAERLFALVLFALLVRYGAFSLPEGAYTCTTNAACRNGSRLVLQRENDTSIFPRRSVWLILVVEAVAVHLKPESAAVCVCSARLYFNI